MGMEFRAALKLLDRLAKGAPPCPGVLLMRGPGGRQVNQLSARLRQNHALRRRRQGADPAGANVNTKNKGKV